MAYENERRYREHKEHRERHERRERDESGDPEEFRGRSSGGIFVPSMGGSSPIRPGLIVALLLIVAGVFLFLDNLGWLHVRDIWDYWPVILIVVGTSKLYGCKSKSNLIWCGLIIASGILFLLSNLNLLRMNIATLSPLILIGVGVLLLTRKMEIHGLPRFASQAEAFSGDSDNVVHELAIFGGVKRMIQSPAFLGGELFTLFGGIEIDLRRARLLQGDKPVVIEANAAFGGINIRVPPDCRVAVRGVGIFGGYEDKTLPPLQPTDLAPLLVITGFAVFGGVTVE